MVSTPHPCPQSPVTPSLHVITMLFFSLWFGDLDPLSELIVLTFPVYGLVGEASDLMAPES